ncbi:hypothetical protein pRL100011 (plasmid) [Rhizobium johnstonii 3841]|uniref:Uncharacterized protein n=1 Tax=Rhizobium johnstonii (strain DSM 114642 / LMG 32736 / 3841) TaxID=216596 RepID=Q1M8B5_RHIJ3|nr:hypothetical protein pRL100011 [Rhizobium johnstonii 3841]
MEAGASARYLRVISAEASPAAFCTYRSSISAEDARPAQRVAREFKSSLDLGGVVTRAGGNRRAHG